jgi:transcriptional regulator with XRE-family HTH domain
MSEHEQKINQIIAENITKLLRLKNRTQLELAEYLGVTQATVSNWCTGVKMPRMDKIDKICEFFSVNRSELMTEKTSSSVKLDCDYCLIDENEIHLIDAYRSLNVAGKDRLCEYAEDLCGMDKYKKCDSDAVAI